MLEELINIDGLVRMSYKDKAVYVHNDHRFLLMILRDAQLNNLVPIPCKLVLFDAHDDLADLNEDTVAILKQLRGDFDEELFTDVVKKRLRCDDSDWQKAAMELGWVSDVLVFGIRHDHTDKENPFIYKDSSGFDHTIFHYSSNVGPLLGYQGSLSDTARRQQLHVLWNTLGWCVQDNGIFGFNKNEDKILLNFDLDVFTMNYDEYLFPWSNEVYEDRFLKESDYYTTKGWSGKTFTKALAEKSGLIIITREPDYCGGVKKMTQIFTDMNRTIFDDSIVN